MGTMHPTEPKKAMSKSQRLNHCDLVLILIPVLSGLMSSAHVSFLHYSALQLHSATNFTKNITSTEIWDFGVLMFGAVHNGSL